MIDRMANLTYDKKIVLAQEIIDFVDAAGLGVFDGHHAILNLACCNCSEDIGKTTVGNWFRRGFTLFSKICSGRFVTEGSTFTLKGDGDDLLRMGGVNLFCLLI